MDSEMLHPWFPMRHAASLNDEAKAEALAVRSLQLDAQKDALIIDLDSAFLSIASASERVTIARTLPQLLTDAATRLSGAVAVISGRPLADIAQLIHPFPGSIAGIYGLERRTAAGTLIKASPDPSLGQARTEFASFVAATPGVTLEDKGLTLVLHFRMRPQLSIACARLAERAAKLSGDRLVVAHSATNIELRPRGVDKRISILEILREPSFWGRRPIIVGHCSACEDGFKAAARFGGVAINVGGAAAGEAKYKSGNAREFLDWLGAAVTPVPIR